MILNFAIATKFGELMFKQLTLLVLMLCLMACSSADEPLADKDIPRYKPIIFGDIATDPEYGYKPNKAIELGSFVRGDNYKGIHYLYFDSLTGPNGEKVSVRRLGTCCPFDDPSMSFGGALLDRFELSYEGIEKPVIIYVDLYKYNQPMAPKGFNFL